MLRIESDGTGCGTVVTDAESGAKVHGITAINLKIVPGDLVRAEVDLMSVSTTVDAVPHWQMIHPKTGDLKEVKMITFSDGETVEL